MTTSGPCRGPGANQQNNIWLYSLTSAYALSADGKKVLYELKGAYTIADAVPAPGANGSRKQLDLGHMRIRVLPMQEWAEMFDNAWRLERDLFVNTPPPPELPAYPSGPGR
jgi:hypothetical protein